MQPISPSEQSTYEHWSDLLKVALVVLAFVATALGATGDKWDNQKKRLTALGYGVLATGILVLMAGLGSWWVDARLKLTSDQRQADAVKHQKQVDDYTIAGLHQVITDLHTAMIDEHTTLEFAKTQLPVESVKISFKRSDIASALPEEFKDKNFSFQKPRGQPSPDDDMLVDFEVSPVKGLPLNLLDAFKTGESAMSAFESVFYRICQIRVLPGDDKDAAKMRVGGNDYDLTAMVADKDLLTYSFAPKGISVSSFDGSPARLEIGKSMAVSFGNNPLPKTTPCYKPHEIALSIKSLGYKIDTGFFPTPWNDSDYNELTVMSPKLKLVSSNESPRSTPTQ